MKKNNFSWRKKTSIFIGRFQPFHQGHEYLFKKALKKNSQVAILVMDSYKINKKNPFKFSEVKKKIYSRLKGYRGLFIIIRIPVVGNVIYGRKVGYEINNIKVPKKIEKISATNIRRKLFK